MITVDLFLCYAFISMLCCVYDFMLNVRSQREEKNELQLFLFLRIPARSVVNVHKVCVDKGLSFIS
jgi:hypothetical protein